MSEAEAGSWPRCWSCILGDHPGGEHTWADAEDVAREVSAGRSDPSEQGCGCTCVAEPPRPSEDPQDDIDTVSLDLTVCRVCGSETACGYDTEGRALIHAEGGNDEEDL